MLLLPRIPLVRRVRVVTPAHPTANLLPAEKQTPEALDPCHHQVVTQPGAEVINNGKFLDRPAKFRHLVEIQVILVGHKQATRIGERQQPVAQVHRQLAVVLDKYHHQGEILKALKPGKIVVSARKRGTQDQVVLLRPPVEFEKLFSLVIRADWVAARDKTLEAWADLTDYLLELRTSLRRRIVTQRVARLDTTTATT